MGTLLSILPGDIEGLLRRGSPVLYAGAAHVIDHMGERAAIMGSNTGLWAMPFAGLLLDLSDPTGRVHAAWWAMAHRHIVPRDGILPTWTCDEPIVVRMACENADMTPAQIDTLRRLVLRLAGRLG
jgi:hypothetical protein